MFHRKTNHVEHSYILLNNKIRIPNEINNLYTTQTNFNNNDFGLLSSCIYIFI